MAGSCGTGSSSKRLSGFAPISGFAVATDVIERPFSGQLSCGCFSSASSRLANAASFVIDADTYIRQADVLAGRVNTKQPQQQQAAAVCRPAGSVGVVTISLGTGEMAPARRVFAAEPGCRFQHAYLPWALW